VHLIGKRGWSNTARNEKFFKDLAAALQSFSFHAVVAFNRVPVADIYFAADPCFKEHKKDFSWWRKLGKRYRYYTSLEASIFSKSPPETLVLTEREIEAFHQHYRTPKEHFHLLPPGVKRNTQSASDAAANHTILRKELGTPDSTIVALFVGSGFRVKGLDRALKAIQSTQQLKSEIEFWVLGNGKASEYRSLAKHAGTTVRFLGGRADVARFYDAADFLLHPAYSESAGKVLLEALTHGLPVLTTDTCGYAAHILKAKAGTVIESPFSQKTLNQTLHTFIQDQDKRQQMSQNGLAYAANEDLYSCHHAAAEIIENILS
jgi:UDP-glucose:(heptosyl)LPS alpha-1,3-glucosyltransferase